MTKINVGCRKCGKNFTFELPEKVDVTASPEMKEAVRNGSMFIAVCPVCGEKTLVNAPMLYSDPEKNLLILLSEKSVNSAGELPGYTARQVATPGDLIEKIGIFEAGLDDIVIELCKYVTLKEMGKDLVLKFVHLDGPDNDMLFSYPENGEMHLLKTGFNVYEDCAGIIARNTFLNDEKKGLVKVDQAWISEFILH